MKYILKEMYDRNLINTFEQGIKLILAGEVVVDFRHVTETDFLIPDFSTIYIGKESYSYSAYPRRKFGDFQEEKSTNQIIEMKIDDHNLRLSISNEMFSFINENVIKQQLHIMMSEIMENIHYQKTTILKLSKKISFLRENICKHCSMYINMKESSGYENFK